MNFLWVRLLLDHKFIGGIDVPFVPNKDDRIVLPNDRYTGYIVLYRELIYKPNQPIETVIHVRLDK